MDEEETEEGAIASGWMDAVHPADDGRAVGPCLPLRG